MATEPVHRNQARAFIAGVIASIVLGAMAFVGVNANSGGEIPGQTYTYVTAHFAQTGTLNEKQDVRQNSRRIGQVVKIEYRDGVTEVLLRIDGEYPVFANATARVGDESPLSKKYIDLQPGTASAGPLEGPIVPPNAGTSVALDDLFDVFDPATRSGLQTALRELSAGTAGHSEDLQAILDRAPGFLDDLRTVSLAASSPEADVPGLLRSADRVVGRFQGRQGEIRGLLRSADTTVQAINVDDTKPLRSALRKLPGTLSEAREGLTTLNGPLGDARSALSTLQPGAAALGRSEDDLRGVLREAVPPLNKVPHVAELAEPAVEDLTDASVDLQPTVPKLARTLNLARPLLKDLSPYACQIGDLVAQNDLLSGRLGPNEHYFSAQPAFPAVYNASLPDPTARINNYPPPNFCRGQR